MKSQTIMLNPRILKLHIVTGTLDEVRNYQKDNKVNLENLMTGEMGLCQQIPEGENGLPQILVSVLDSSTWEVMSHELLHACAMYESIFNLEGSDTADEWHVSLHTYLLRVLNWEALGFPKELDNVMPGYH